jgi:hypothetical protein
MDPANGEPISPCGGVVGRQRRLARNGRVADRLPPGGGGTRANRNVLPPGRV